MKDYPKNILLIRTDNVGDLIVSLPTCTYLKQIYPGVKITLLHRSYVKDIVPICDSIDDFISIEETDIISNPDKFINIVLDKKIDACVNLVGHVSQNMAKKISLAIERNILKHLKFYIKRKDGLKLRIQVLVNNIQRKIQNDKITNCL